jgi:Ser/Thr protein kinase RdoA (MazF antagonist)
MTDFDYAMQKPSSLDIAKAFNSWLGIDERRPQDLMR